MPAPHPNPNRPLCLASHYNDEDFSGVGPAQFLIDSAATTHICHNVALFHSYTPLDTPQYILTGAGPLPISGYGTCVVQDQDNHTLTLNQVMHVPNCPVNIYSTSKLNAEGGSFTATNLFARIITRLGLILTTFLHFQRIYLLIGVYPTHSAFASIANDWHTWHKRLGHPSYDSIKRMRTLKCVNGMMIEVDNEDIPECIACIQGKFRRTPFTSDTKTYLPLQLLHSDICGPFPTALNGHRWFTTVRDKATGYTLAHSHTHKHEAAEVVKQAIIKLQRETGLRVKALRSDRGGEYMSHNMQRWLLDNGIEHQPTPIESSQTNGVAERVNLTIMNRVRATLISTNQPRILWPWAMSHVTHALNFIPSNSKSVTPHQLMFGSPPDVSHLIPFGSVVATWRPTQKRQDKLEPRADLGHFVGYTPTRKIFQVSFYLSFTHP